MGREYSDALKNKMRDRYAVHYSKLASQGETDQLEELHDVDDDIGEELEAGDVEPEAEETLKDDGPSIDASDQWRLLRLAGVQATSGNLLASGCGCLGATCCGLKNCTSTARCLPHTSWHTRKPFARTLSARKNAWATFSMKRIRNTVAHILTDHCRNSQR